MCYLRVPLSFALVLCKSHTVTVSGLGNWLASLKHITPQAGAARSRREWQREKWCRDSSTTDQAAFVGGFRQDSGADRRERGRASRDPSSWYWASHQVDLVPTRRLGISLVLVMWHGAFLSN